MLLENNFYHVVGKSADNQKTVYTIELLPDCDVYRGHFPGRPVCPGVCNMETIKELAILTAGHKLAMSKVKKCRFLAVATPVENSKLNVSISCDDMGETVAVTAQISDTDKVYVDFKGEMTRI